MDLKKEWTFQIFFWNQMRGVVWRTTQGDEVQIADCGFWNFADGPDFLEVEGTLNGELWKGPVEIHRSSTDWYRHQHEKDDAYNRVWLHVVYTLGDRNPDIPTIVLKDQWMPDSSLWNRPIIADHVFSWETKKMRWQNWTFNFSILDAKMIALSRTLGRHTQGEAMEMWAKSIPWSKIPQHWTLLQIHAFFHLMAGHLDQVKATDDYVQCLLNQQEVFHWASDLPRHNIPWRKRVSMMARPHFKVAQMAQLFFGLRLWSSHDVWNTAFVSLVLQNLNVPEYWQWHYQLGQPMKSKQSIQMSCNAIESVVGNLSVFILEENLSSLKKNDYHDQNHFGLL